MFAWPASGRRGRRRGFPLTLRAVVQRVVPYLDDGCRPALLADGGGHGVDEVVDRLSQPLAPGVYPGAQHVAFRQPGAPGLEVTADGRGCSQVDGTFTVDAVTFGPNGYLQTLDASLEQYCDGAPAALRGDLHLANPAPLQLDLTVNPDGIVSPVSGEAIISGTYSCSQNTTLRMSGRLAQVVKREIVSGMISIYELPCTAGAPIPWSTYVSPSGTPFNKGDAEAVVFLRNADGTAMIERRVIVRLAKR